MMKIVRFERAGLAQYGVVEADRVFSLVGDLFGEFHAGDMVCDLKDAKILAPVVPSKVLAIGLNYAAHVKEGIVDREVPSEPVLFMKPTSAIVGHLDPVIYPTITQQVSYEAELVVVIGKRAKNVTEAEAGEYILGYTCGNDVTARDLQRKDGQWTRGKGFDTFCPLGPFVVTGIDASNLRIQCRINGAVKQDSSTSYLIHGINKLVSFISQVMPLLPGDVIMTGTPEGVGLVKPGDVMEVEIEGIGILRNSIVAA